MWYLCSVFEIKQINITNQNQKTITTKNKKKMTTTRIKTIGKIKDVTFRNTSIYGNPSYYILFEDETGETIKGYTAPNAACAYGCTNSELREFACIVYHVTKGGKVIIDNILGKSVTE